MPEEERLALITQFEREYWDKNLLVAGVDEVGRGPLAGPVVVACVIMPKEPLLHGVNDSKKVSPGRREKLAVQIRESAVAFTIEETDAAEIDAINILQATRGAMTRAVQTIGDKPACVFVDAVANLPFSLPQRAIVHGDALSYSIAAASIVAKVYRDELMIRMDELYPEYGFARNKGYGTAEHIAALRQYGPCPIHRKSFITRILG